jgi:hypothetical protein
MCSRRNGIAVFALIAALLLPAGRARADSHLLFLEAQGIAGYSFRDRRTLFYSMNKDAEMQKPSLGFDYLHRLSGEGGDIASFALQARLAAVAGNERYEHLEGQVYNAWLKVKTPVTDVWVGHNRPAIGIGSYFDSHGLLLRTLPIQGFGYDRDWGIGTYRDLSWGNVAFTLTTGSGMPVYFRGNYLAAGRVSAGVLNEDNWNVGISAAGGRTLDTMGYELREEDPKRAVLYALDATYLQDMLEHRVDLLRGKWLGEDTAAVMYRLGLLLGPEGRIRIEAQPTWWKGAEENYLLSGCVSAQVTSDFTARVMYEYDHRREDSRVILQLYLYKPM